MISFCWEGGFPGGSPATYSQQSLIWRQQPWGEFTQQLQEGQVDETQTGVGGCCLLKGKLYTIPRTKTL